MTRFDSIGLHNPPAMPPSLGYVCIDSRNVENIVGILVGPAYPNWRWTRCGGQLSCVLPDTAGAGVAFTGAGVASTGSATGAAGAWHEQSCDVCHRKGTDTSVAVCAKQRDRVELRTASLCTMRMCGSHPRGFVQYCSL